MALSVVAPSFTPYIAAASCHVSLSSNGLSPRRQSLVVLLSSNGLLPRRQSLVLRCQAVPEQPPQEPTVASTSPPPATPKTTPKVSTKFSDVLAFSGPAPERINGRLAMLGFVSALAVEATRGDGLIMQFTNGGLPWFVGTAVLFSAASLVPLFKRQKVENKNNGLMNANAEMWNGRFAMLGLVALAFTEYLTGGPLV